MKNFSKLLIATSAIALVSSQGFAASTTGTAVATVVAPLSFGAKVDLNFGTFAGGDTAGTITEAGVKTGGVTSVTAGNQGSFVVNGNAALAYTFTLPATATLTGAGDDMSAALSFNSGAASRTLTAGTETVAIKGVLTVGINQAAGSYSGTYNVSVAYN